LKKYSILIITLFSVSLFALDINTAVTRGLDQSHRLKESALNQNISNTFLEKSKSAYRPEINAEYFAAISEQNSPDNSDNPSYASISLSYNLFNGFKDKYSIEGAKENLENSTYLKDALYSDIKLEIQLAYIDVLEKQKTLTTKKEAIELIEKSLKDTNAYYAQGLVAKNSVLETKLSLSKSKQDLLIAKSALRASRDTLDRFLGGTLLKGEVLEEVSFKVASLDDVDLLVELGLKNRSEIKALKSSLREAEFLYSSSKADLYPRADFSLSHIQNGYDAGISGRDNWYDNQTQAGINISYNLYKGGSYELDRANFMYKTQILNEKIEILKLDIVLQIKKAKEAYELSIENRKVTEDAQELAEENFSIMSKRYKAQLEKTTDFLNARLNLSETKVAHAKSIYFIYAQYAKLLRAVE